MGRHRQRATAALALVLVGTLVAALGACAPAAPSVVASPVAVAVAVASPPPASPTPSPSPTPTPSPTPSPTPLSAESHLTGLPADPQKGHRTPIAVMIDDARAARPQSGFNGAAVVYQAPADGYETRYLMIFGDADSAKVGPVRSARLYLVQWSMETASTISHYGGDRRTRIYIKAHPELMSDVDGIGAGAKAYHRVKSRNAPHNAYTSTKSLRKMAIKLKAPLLMAADIHQRAFVDASPIKARAASQRIRIPYNTNVVTWSFDRRTDRYRRSVNGTPQIDPADGKRVTTTNVVVLFQKFRIDTKIEPGHARPDITTIGTGVAWIYREGRVLKATWRKASDTAPTLLLDKAGKEIPLIRGRTFFQVVPRGTKVTHGR